MNLLLDAHAFLWFVWNDPHLSPAARLAIMNPASKKWLGVGSIWEIAIKVSVGKLNLGEPVAPFMNKVVSANNFSVLMVGLEHAAAVSTLPFHHRDPFDRLLVAQAMVENLAIVSADVALDAYHVTRIW